MKLKHAALLAAFAFILSASLEAAPRSISQPKASPEATAEPTKEASKEATPQATLSPSPEAASEASKEKKEEAAEETVKVKSSAGHKSAGLAVTLAFFPGLVIHGTGHMYAGSWVKGLGLCAVGTAGAVIAAGNSASLGSDISSIANANSNGTIPNDLSGAYSRIGLVLVGTLAYIWTGWDDLSGCAIAVDKYNQRIDKANRAKLEFAPRGDGAQLALTRRF